MTGFSWRSGGFGALGSDLDTATHGSSWVNSADRSITARLLSRKIYTPEQVIMTSITSPSISLQQKHAYRHTHIYTLAQWLIYELESLEVGGTVVVYQTC